MVALPCSRTSGLPSVRKSRWSTAWRVPPPERRSSALTLFSVQVAVQWSLCPRQTSTTDALNSSACTKPMSRSSAVKARSTSSRSAAYRRAKKALNVSRWWTAPFVASSRLRLECGEANEPRGLMG
eukprot:7266886-Prymnesium_polylepis.1